MGGGDLNLKKSWHPHTMKNQERVWKAEQKDNEEKKRIAELQRELNAERSKEDLQKLAEDSGVLKKKDDVKLEWMYKGPSQSVNHEEYLLGKAIDKNFEKHSNEAKGLPPQDEESLPDAVRQAKSSMFSEQVDMARKMHEDPLMAIRQRAVEKAKQLYNNPVRLKQIQKLIAGKSEDREHKKDKKKKKKSKKSSKKDEDKELDALLTAKLKNALKDRDLFRKIKKKAHRSSSQSSNSSSDDGSDSDETNENLKDRKRNSSPNLHNRETGAKSSRKRSNSPSELRVDRRQKYSTSYCDERDTRRRSRSPRASNKRDSYSHSSRRRSRSRSRDKGKQNSLKDQSSKNLERKGDRDRRRSNSQEAGFSGRTSSPSEKRRTVKDSSSDSDRKDNYDDSDSDSNRRKKRTFGLMMADGSKPVVKQRPVEKEVKPPPTEQTKPTPWQKKERVRLTEEEKEKRRQEMLANASWRDKERSANVKRYRIEEAREREELHQNFDDDFARKQFSKAADQTSVEGRIKSKLNTIQRSNRAMDQNFARR